MKLGRDVSRHNELDNWRNTHRYESVMATIWLFLTISETDPGLWDRLIWASNFSGLRDGHDNPIGIWSPDGATLWVGQWASNDINAYPTAAKEGTPPPLLTASLENASASHDGESDFTFELRFSEEFTLNYKTLRDHAFTVLGGTVKKAQRMDKPSNIHWQITVKPNVNAKVTIILPATEGSTPGVPSAPGTGGSCPTGWN